MKNKDIKMVIIRDLEQFLMACISTCVRRDATAGRARQEAYLAALI